MLYINIGIPTYSGASCVWPTKGKRGESGDLWPLKLRSAGDGAGLLHGLFSCASNSISSLIIFCPDSTDVVTIWPPAEPCASVLTWQHPAAFETCVLPLGGDRRTSGPCRCCPWTGMRRRRTAKKTRVLSTFCGSLALSINEPLKIPTVFFFLHAC